MSENQQTPAAPAAENTVEETPAANSTSNRHPNRFANRAGNVQSSTPRDYEGATPKIGGILTLRSENMTKKVSYDIFCEKLRIYVMNEFKNGEHIVEVTRDPSVDVLKSHNDKFKPKELTAKEKLSSIDVDIKREEVKDFVKDIKVIKTNLKKVYNLVYGNCTDSVQTMLKADSDYEDKSKDFDHAWIFNKVKTIVAGLDKKLNLRVTLHSALTSYILLK